MFRSNDFLRYQDIDVLRGECRHRGYLRSAVPLDPLPRLTPLASTRGGQPGGVPAGCKSLPCRDSGSPHACSARYEVWYVLPLARWERSDSVSSGGRTATRSPLFAVLRTSISGTRSNKRLREWPDTEGGWRGCGVACAHPPGVDLRSLPVSLARGCHGGSSAPGRVPPRLPPA